MGVSVELCDDQAMGQPGIFRGIHFTRNGLVESAHSRVDILSQSKRVAQASDVAHAHPR